MGRFLLETTPLRSKIMSKIKSKDTIPEILLRKELWRQGIRFTLKNKDLPGNPDIVIRKARLAIFVDGEFWHGYNWSEKKERIKSNKEYWISKIEANIKRDTEANENLKKMGFEVIRFWDQQIRKELNTCVGDVISILS